MINHYIRFLIFITQNLTQIAPQSSSQVMDQKIFQSACRLRETTGYLEQMSKVMRVWVDDRGHGSAWSGVVGRIEKIYYVMKLLDEDLSILVYDFDQEDRDISRKLRVRLRGGPSVSKFDVFDKWLQILRSNSLKDGYRSGETFCDWESDHSTQPETRTLSVPAYSLLNPYSEKATIDSEEVQKYWLFGPNQELFRKRDFQLNVLGLSHYAVPKYQANGKEITYPIHIKLPDDNEIILEIVQEIESKTNELKVAVNQLISELVDQKSFAYFLPQL